MLQRGVQDANHCHTSIARLSQRLCYAPAPGMSPASWPGGLSSFRALHVGGQQRTQLQPGWHHQHLCPASSRPTAGYFILTNLIHGTCVVLVYTSAAAHAASCVINLKCNSWNVGSTDSNSSSCKTVSCASNLLSSQAGITSSCACKRR